MEAAFTKLAGQSGGSAADSKSGLPSVKTAVESSGSGGSGGSDADAVAHIKHELQSIFQTLDRLAAASDTASATAVQALTTAQSAAAAAAAVPIQIDAKIGAVGKGAQNIAGMIQSNSLAQCIPVSTRPHRVWMCSDTGRNGIESDSFKAGRFDRAKRAAVGSECEDGRARSERVDTV